MKVASANSAARGTLLGAMTNRADLGARLDIDTVIFLNVTMKAFSDLIFGQNICLKTKTTMNL